MSTPLPLWQETVRKIGSYDWDGEHIEVGPDADGMLIVELRYRDKDHKITSRFTVPPDAAPLVAAAIVKCAKELEAERARENHS